MFMRTHSLVVFSAALLCAVVLSRVILVQYFDSCRVRNKERAGLRGCIFIFMCENLDECRIRTENKLKILYHNKSLSLTSFEWKALFNVPGLQGRVATTTASKSSCSWKWHMKILGPYFWHYKLHTTPGEPINRFF